MGALRVQSAGPGVSVQDRGRAGYLAFGLSRGGAADTLALAEGAALLQQDESLAAIEMAVMGGQFEAQGDLRIALTGAPMLASIDGQSIVWNASHPLPSGSCLSIGAVTAGSYGYLHVGGGIDEACLLGARSTHMAAGIGKTLQVGDILDIGDDPKLEETGLVLPSQARWNGGTLRMLPSLQSDWFDPLELERFEQCEFTRDTRGNRMGVRLLPGGETFHSEAGLSVLSEVIVPGDIQVTGDGTPFVLLCECGTTGGYPRIGSVLPADMPLISQAPAGSIVGFRFITLDEALSAQRRDQQYRQSLAHLCQPLIRDPHKIADLLSYQLVSGATSGL